MAEELEQYDLIEKVSRLLRERNYKLVTAESCTGGMLASAIVDLPGASDVFSEGYITYSNEVKQKCLKVSKETLDQYGAVSRQTAKEMAAGAAMAGGAEAALSVTGLAGPGGGTKEVPEGTVYIGCCLNGRVCVEHLQLEGGRMEIRKQAVVKALQLLHDCLLDYK